MPIASHTTELPAGPRITANRGQVCLRHTVVLNRQRDETAVVQTT
jgi:hypothetical protein